MWGSAECWNGASFLPRMDTPYKHHNSCQIKLHLSPSLPLSLSLSLTHTHTHTHNCYPQISEYFPPSSYENTELSPKPSPSKPLAASVPPQDNLIHLFLLILIKGSAYRLLTTTQPPTTISEHHFGVLPSECLSPMSP